MNKEKITQEGKKWAISLIPFSNLTRKVRKWQFEDDHGTKSNGERFFLNSVISAVTMATTFFYGLEALNYGDINYKNWSGIQEERRIEAERELEKQIISDFYIADSDSDSKGFLDQKEFYNFMRKNFDSSDRYSQQKQDN